MLKVLQLIPTLDRSGAEKQMVMLAKGLPRNRFEVEVATLTRHGPFEAELRAAGIPVTSISKRFKLDPMALDRLARFLKARKFDVVQSWIFAANAYGRVAARLARVPVVVVAEMAVDLWKGRSEQFIDRRLATWCDRLVGNSNAVVDFYRKLGVPDDRLAMIYSGTEDTEPPLVDPRAIRAELGFEIEAPVLLFAGRLAEQKRVNDLLKALDLLQHVQPDLRSVIVGDGFRCANGLRRLLRRITSTARSGFWVIAMMYHGSWQQPTWSSYRVPMKDCPTWCSRQCSFVSPWLLPGGTGDHRGSGRWRNGATGSRREYDAPGSRHPRCRPR